MLYCFRYKLRKYLHDYKAELSPGHPLQFDHRPTVVRLSSLDEMIQIDKLDKIHTEREIGVVADQVRGEIGLRELSA